ncbi:hypothetical protein J6590_014919 [Homalodisca vitripennis]|nr:hypothetical protein J6590_014919 [Homalodisca vitripennis]
MSEGVFELSTSQCSLELPGRRSTHFKKSFMRVSFCFHDNRYSTPSGRSYIQSVFISLVDTPTFTSLSVASLFSPRLSLVNNGFNGMSSEVKRGRPSSFPVVEVQQLLTHYKHEIINGGKIAGKKNEVWKEIVKIVNSNSTRKPSLKAEHLCIAVKLNRYHLLDFILSQGSEGISGLTAEGKQMYERQQSTDQELRSGVFIKSETEADLEIYDYNYMGDCPIGCVQEGKST